MPLKKQRKVILWFHTDDITQATVVALSEHFAAFDVRFRKVVRDEHRDILEAFDAVGGAVPQRYAVAAQAKGLDIYNEIAGGEHLEINTDSGSTSVSAAGGSGAEIVPAPKAAEATKGSTVAPPAPADATAPPAPVSASVPPPK